MVAALTRTPISLPPSLRGPVASSPPQRPGGWCGGDKAHIDAWSLVLFVLDLLQTRFLFLPPPSLTTSPQHCVSTRSNVSLSLWQSLVQRATSPRAGALEADFAARNFLFESSPVGNGHSLLLHGPWHVLLPSSSGLFALIALRYQRSRQLRKSTGGAGNITRQFQRAKYDKLPTVDDSGVVLNDSEVEYHHQQYEERATQIASAGSHSTASTAHPDHDDTLIHSHKAVVGPDELVPGVEDPVPAEEETLKGTKNLLMWLPAIFDVSALRVCFEFRREDAIASEEPR